MHARLTGEQASSVLRWLALPPPRATRAWLDALLRAYASHVPWESASRIVRRATTRDDAACVADPLQFWDHAMQRGTGGTCFESNAALAALLEAVDIPVTRTINDRPPVPASHTALLVDADGDTCVVDAGFPLYASLPLPRAGETCTVRTPWGSFSSQRLDGHTGRFRITQHPHPRPLAFELIARPVTPEAYAAATCADYGPGGLFLDRVIVKKLVDGEMWRFASGERPWELERFTDGVRHVRELPQDVAGAARGIAGHLGIDEGVVREALTIVSGPDHP